LQSFGVIEREVVVVLQQRLWNIARETRGEANKAFAVLL
jgi:hypothetical protein